jgi:hypothetical protein
VLTKRETKGFDLKLFAPRRTPKGIPSSAEIRVLKNDILRVTAIICRSSGSGPKIKSKIEEINSKTMPPEGQNCPSGH